MIVDAHCHLDPELPVPDLLAAMDRAGIGKAVLIPAAQAPVGDVPALGATIFRECLEHIRPLRRPLYRMAGRSRRLQPYPHPDNRSVFETARAHPDRFLPFVFLNPALARSAHEGLDRALAGGVKGVKLHAWFHDYRLIHAAPILARCEAANLPVLVHLGDGPPEDVRAVREYFPKLKLIVAHAGIPHFERLWSIEGIWFDVAAPQLCAPKMIRRLVAAVGADRVLYGSDAPIGIRMQGGHAYELPDLPDRAFGENLLSLL